jgi:hypothetical protein
MQVASIQCQVSIFAYPLGFNIYFSGNTTFTQVVIQHIFNSSIYFRRLATLETYELQDMSLIQCHGLMSLN